MEKHYEIVCEERVFKTPRMEGVRRTLRAEDGDEFTHTIIKSQPSVAIIVRKEGKIAFIKQLRSTTGKYYLEIPAGLLNEGEGSILDAARREVREETGFIAKNVKLLVQGPSLLDPSKSDEDFGVAIADFCAEKEQVLIANYQQSFAYLNKMLEERYKELISQLKRELAKYASILELAFDKDVNIAFEGSVALANYVGVTPERILQNKRDIDQYFLN